MGAEYNENFWLRLAQSRGYASELEMWKGLYRCANGHLTVCELATALCVDDVTVRRRLVLHNIPITTPLLSDEELDGILSEGMAVAARRLGVRYKTLHFRVTRALNARRRAAQGRE